MSTGNKRWNIAYVAIIVANIVFGILFYLISQKYGNR